MSEADKKWWLTLSDECPITLEPLSELPYPPFILYSSNDKRNAGKGSNAAAPGSQYYFDGLALATYVISRGNYANPLTRSPLTYDDCVRLDEYLNENVYGQSREQLDSTIFRRDKISVREAYVLRDSIKVKVATGNAENEEQERRAQVLRNEAAVALRGLFVFGHHAQDQSSSASARNATNQSSNLQQLPPSVGGFDLNYNPNLNETHSWGFTSAEQEGLRIIDDNEAAFGAAETAAWREIQEAFPHLMGSDIATSSDSRQSQSNNGPSEFLDIARRTADMTAKEEQEKAELQERNFRLYFLEALERKKKRLLQKQQLKATAAATLLNEQRAKDELQSARNEIDRWRELQWQSWENVAIQQSEMQKQESKISRKIEKVYHCASTSDQHSLAETQQQVAAENEEARKRAALKMKAKRQRRKERAKEKKKIENALNEEKERALELQKKKDDSEVKCGCCGQGVLGCGFEKFGVKFCCTKCARSGLIN